MKPNQNSDTPQPNAAGQNQSSQITQLNSPQSIYQPHATQFYQQQTTPGSAAGQPAQQQTSPVLTSRVRYQKKRTPLMKAPWGTLTYQNHTFTFYDENNNLLLQLPVSAVKNIKRYNMALNVYGKDNSYHIFWFENAGTAVALATLGGTAGLFGSDALERQSGVDDWIATIKQDNPNLQLFNASWKNQWIVALTITGVVVVVAVVVLLMLFLSSGNS